MRSFFSTLLISNWLYLFFLFLIALGVLYLDSIINPDLRIILFSLFFLIAVFGSFYVSYSIAQIVILPLKQVERKTDEINAGDFGTELIKPEIHELAKLTGSINGMAKRLKNQFFDLNLEKEKFNSLLQNLQEGVFAVDYKNTVLFQNLNLPSHLMKPNSQNLSLNESEPHPNIVSLIEEARKQSTESKGYIETEDKHYNVKIYPLKNDGYIYLFLGVVLDITEEKQNQIIREQFFQNASHELKTPITSIMGFAETLDAKLGYPEDSQEKQFLEAILRNTNRMTRIIDDMMTISKLESPQTYLVKERFPLRQTTENICASLISILDQKNQDLVIDIPESMEIEADQVLMEHLIINLVSNASHYSPGNTKITIKAYPLVDGEQICLEFIDQGIGIPKQDIDRIFERFYRVDSNRSRKEGGTGLGLSIVKHICKLHGNDISVSSELGKGTTFRIILTK